MPVAALVAIGLLGLLIGSFVNVVIHRVPARTSVVRPGSHCPHCEHQLGPAELIPVVSWLLQGGRCRSCSARISAMYPLVELSTAALFVAVAASIGAEAVLVAFLVFTAVLVAVTVIDLHHYIVPNRIVAWSMGVGVVLLGLAGVVDGELDRFVRSLVGSLAAGGFLLVVHLVQPRGMGAGDVKLAFVLGLHLGWLGLDHVALGLFLGFALGALIGLGLMVVGRRGRKDAVPFAPFLAAGAMLALLVGAPLLDWYAGA